MLPGHRRCRAADLREQTGAQHVRGCQLAEGLRALREKILHVKNISRTVSLLECLVWYLTALFVHSRVRILKLLLVEMKSSSCSEER